MLSDVVPYIYCSSAVVEVSLFCMHFVYIEYENTKGPCVKHANKKLLSEEANRMEYFLLTSCGKLLFVKY